ncbi:uroporphyrinogen-III C-methyltransferase [Azospirillum sp. YIM B02556]|uniref:uroporphyrinogen-III C-methyltransferase n=1 Tax=Azospirillum endophyticum TaxID=2800326 RepID=A0ABS1F3Y6_9PROT|nr:uroporphyrinogen-III C-methyltransferase [Azospirillum endophyticum]MBK1838133.1 uroporphyrinogen-III C-methyltransferase [Azospirillum endophyticum]
MSFESSIPESVLVPFAPGSVWLAGSGPGDPGLLTLLALQGLRQADVIVHDALVGERIMALAGPSARLEFAGKRGGRPSAHQDDITSRLIELAKEGHRVLRLKGGDPFVFGRGGEEAQALAAEGIPFRIVPGITSGIAGPAYAGIPATHRDTNQAVILATGHSLGGGPDWRALAATKVPLILYMGWKALPTIVAELMAGGLSADTPVGVVTEATTANQKSLVTSLGTCVADLAASGLEPPAIIVIGDMVRLRPALDWLPAQAALRNAGGTNG